MSALEYIFEDLKALRPDRLGMEKLHPAAQSDQPFERQAALACTFGCLLGEEADEMERVIEEGCEQINEHGWQCPVGHQRVVSYFHGDKVLHPHSAGANHRAGAWDGAL